MKRSIRTKYINLDLVKGIVLGVGYDDMDLMVAIGPVILTIKLWAFKRSKPTKSKYEIEL